MDCVRQTNFASKVLYYRLYVKAWAKLKLNRGGLSATRGYNVKLRKDLGGFTAAAIFQPAHNAHLQTTAAHLRNS